MLKRLLASHGMLASGMKNSVELLMGNADNLTVADAYLDERDFNQVLHTFLQECSESDQILLLSDVYGGSVNQAMLRVLDTMHNAALICGVNLPLLLEIMFLEEYDDEKLEEIINMAKDGIKRCRPILSAPHNEEEFFD